MDISGFGLPILALEALGVLVAWHVVRVECDRGHLLVLLHLEVLHRSLSGVEHVHRLVV